MDSHVVHSNPPQPMSSNRRPRVPFPYSPLSPSKGDPAKDAPGLWSHLESHTTVYPSMWFPAYFPGGLIPCTLLYGPVSNIYVFLYYLSG